MNKIHVLYKKEEIKELQMKGKAAVVLDILLATSTIVTALAHGAKEIIPVKNSEEAEKCAAALEPGSYLLAGEYEGKTIQGFLDPNPASLLHVTEGKSLVLSTTNGTVAVAGSFAAEKVYIASLLNLSAVAAQLEAEAGGRTIVIICSGSSGRFCMEDFYGAGALIAKLLIAGERDLTDAARAALLFYNAYAGKAEEILLQSSTGKMLEQYGLNAIISFISREDVYTAVPVLKGSKLLGRGDEEWKKRTAWD
ncbi:2-phosphosulfolactate phosphatase [Bacillus lacus]|uniref:Probable 2-phosphosulfolactate phosphatase n=1 Tax=Metabacillus lacus TaxID=1983721 RepID=A0A7X2IYX0_9BACI|nr:2-phosphosulfolactate phosphatase [Metabacillus lacus]MRX72235.1 2-phosphosulfolactate phosphatase [Metabacillus lacus]